MATVPSTTAVRRTAAVPATAVTTGRGPVRRRLRGEDAVLGAWLRTGHPDAFAQAYRRHHRRLAGVIAAHLPSRHDASVGDLVQDLLQDTFCAAIGNPAVFADAHVYRALRRLARRACTAHATANRVNTQLADPATTTGRDTVPAVPVSRPALRDAVAALPVPERRTIELLYLDGHPQAAVARLMRRPVSAIVVLHRRGLAQLREHLGHTEPDTRQVADSPANVAADPATTVAAGLAAAIVSGAVGGR
jgi:DNA-directed RNA polymerase specialized sigma24 family protein